VRGLLPLFQKRGQGVLVGGILYHDARRNRVELILLLNVEPVRGKIDVEFSRIEGMEEL